MLFLWQKRILRYWSFFWGFLFVLFFQEKDPNSVSFWRRAYDREAAAEAQVPVVRAQPRAAGAPGAAGGRGAGRPAGEEGAAFVP